MAYGRKPKLTTEQLEQAVREYASTEVSLLSKKLGVNRSTVWRRMKEIPQEQIDKILREVAELELKPAEAQYEVFLQIPEVVDFNEKLKRKLTKNYRSRMLHILHRVCVHLKIHPAKLEGDRAIEICAELIKDTELDKTPFDSVGELQRGLRTWFQRQGVSAEKLTSMGIEATKPKRDLKRSHARLTTEQRQRFMEVLKKKLKALGVPEEEYIQWITLPPYLYYTGTRIVSSLLSRIEELERDKPQWIHNVIDKRRLAWRKRVSGELKDLIARLLELRGNPEEGLLFTLFETIKTPSKRSERVGEVFKEVYEEAGIPKNIWEGMPCHIWRHTACQDLLEATNYNFEMVAEILGWESVDTMKKHYGAIGDGIIDKALAKAMGEKIEWKTKEFKF